MAEATQQPADPVAGLVDIPLPGPISLWPQTLAARIVIALLIAGAVAGAWWFIRSWRANRYRRTALAELDRIAHPLATGDAQTTSAAALALLVRRTALAAFPREQVAALAGPSWLAFLDRSYGGDEFSHGAGSALDVAPYRPSHASAQESRALIDLVRRWIKTHHE